MGIITTSGSSWYWGDPNDGFTGYRHEFPQWQRNCNVCHYRWVTRDYREIACPACATRDKIEARKAALDVAGKEVMKTSNKEADFTSISISGETVAYSGIESVYRIVTAGKDGSIGIQGKDHAKLQAALERAEGRMGLPALPAPKLSPPPPPVVFRIGDTERDKTLDALSEHLAEGRIRLDEFQDRSDKAVAATTQPELNALLADLPHAFRKPDVSYVTMEFHKDKIASTERVWKRAVVSLTFVYMLIIILIMTGVLPS